MQDPPEVAHSRLFFWTVLCLYLLASLLFTQEYFARTIEWRQATIEKMIRFEADNPFQYRILAPLVVRAVVAATPLEPYAASKILTIIWTFFSLLAFRLLLRNFFTPELASFGALLLAYAMYWNYAFSGIWRMPFDVPAILLCILCLHFLLRRRWRLFYLFFVLGTLNRETIIFVTAVFILLSWKKETLAFVMRHVVVQLGIWLAVRVVLAFLFRGNEGGQFQNQLAANVGNLLSGNITLTLLLSFGGLWLPALLSIRVVDLQIRRLLLLTIPFVGLMLVVGNLHELRIYNELVPVVCIAALGAVAALYNRIRLKGPAVS